MPSSPDTLSDRLDQTVRQEVTNVGEVKEGRGEHAGDGADTERRVGEVPGVQSEPKPIGASSAGAEAVRDEQRPVTVQQAFMGELVGTQGGIKTAAEMAANPPAFRGQTHGKVNAKHGVHMPPKSPAAYTCGDCLDLERRIRIAFKSMGFEF